MSKMDPVIPFMQDFLSSVEVLELGTDNSPRDVDGLDEALHTVPYMSFYTMSSPAANLASNTSRCMAFLYTPAGF